MKKSQLIYFTIFLLTVLDILFTCIGLKLDIIEEANPLMDYFLNISMHFTVLFVLLFVGISLVFIYRVKSQVPWLPKVLVALAVVKIWVIVLHIRWITVYLVS
ncbi:DUF5658 family protein [Serpentinicella alkaliphila]|uniref:DUF5658 domain-containing protein n=1 Tax=Serpentinicella alkaliphila TaxID=1734049 RepID=A0A4R2THD8_9FIRM|nr:DUF5658 family protein [Serpentinicella alkaliphila]QUH26658.1 hypothetical protein HZR23_13625 [Serpentinicella alkaliphila]TCQ00545.1 hypothetical protein EDD79_103034 [Serpentinicella alkaliphila]